MGPITGMDFYMQPWVLLMYFICTEFPSCYSHKELFVREICSLKYHKKFIARFQHWWLEIRVCVCGGGMVIGSEVSWVDRHYQMGIYVAVVSAKLNIDKKL